MEPCIFHPVRGTSYPPSQELAVPPYPGNQESRRRWQRGGCGLRPVEMLQAPCDQQICALAGVAGRQAPGVERRCPGTAHGKPAVGSSASAVWLHPAWGSRRFPGVGRPLVLFRKQCLVCGSHSFSWSGAGLAREVGHHVLLPYPSP